MALPHLRQTPWLPAWGGRAPPDPCLHRGPAALLCSTGAPLLRALPGRACWPVSCRGGTAWVIITQTLLGSHVSGLAQLWLRVLETERISYICSTGSGISLQLTSVGLRRRSPMTSRTMQHEQVSLVFLCMIGTASRAHEPPWRPACDWHDFDLVRRADLFVQI